MKILVIGSKGFIGSYCLTTLGLEHEVWGCDVVTDYESKKYLQIDATTSDFHELFRKNQFDICINCSGAASVPDSFVHPLRDLLLNTFNVAKMLESIKIFNPECKFINLSSAAIYGDPVKLPITESAEPLPLSPYGYHKKYAEDIVKEFALFFKLRTCSLRLFSVYGAGLKKQFFWDLHTKILSSDHIELWGTGNESRDFIYVEDVVNAIICVINNGAFAGECINIANGTEVIIKDVAALFKKTHYKEFTFSFAGVEHEGYPVNWKADIDLLKGMGYQQQVSIEAGVQKYIDWLKAGG
jgi:UDP-glucose 4-epimerase